MCSLSFEADVMATTLFIPLGCTQLYPHAVNEMLSFIDPVNLIDIQIQNVHRTNQR